MGKHFGELAKIYGIVEYQISSFEQKAFAGYFSHTLANNWRRFTGQVFKVVPPFIGGYCLFDWAEKRAEQLKRKNPEDYANDV